MVVDTKRKTKYLKLRRATLIQILLPQQSNKKIFPSFGEVDRYFLEKIFLKI